MTKTYWRCSQEIWIYFTRELKMKEQNVIGGYLLPPWVFALFQVMDYEELWMLFAYLTSDEWSEQEQTIWSELCCQEHWLAYAAWIIIKEYNDHLDSNK
jgi:hypothetical protein